MRRSGRILMALTVPLLLADAPGDYAVRVPVIAAPGGGIQRLAVPTRILVASRMPGLADLRLFDAAGQPMPMARVGGDAPARRAIRLPALPIVGAAGALAVTGVSLRVEGGRARVVRVEGTPADGSAMLPGILLDTRRIADPVDRLVLDADVPRGQPVALTVEASEDLATWRPIAAKTIYRADAAATDATIAFPSVTPAGQYLRVSWDAGRLVSPVVIRSVTVVTIPAADPSAWPRAIVRGAAAEGEHAIAFTLPFATPAAAVEIGLTEGDAVIPLRIVGRDSGTQPWRVLAEGTAYRVTQAGRVRRNPPFLISNAPRTLRIEADPRTPGFARPPEIAVRLLPAAVIFLAGGRPPFTLAAGQAGAADHFLPAASLTPGSIGLGTLPRATTSSAPDPMVEAMLPEYGSGRSLWLWAVLLAGTALLAGMVWRLLRQRAATA